MTRISPTTCITRRRLCAATVLLPAAAAFAPRARAAEFSYKLGLELRDDQPLPRRMTEACKAILAESGGRLEIRPFPNAQLGSSQEMLTQVRQGSLEMVTTSFGLLSSVIPTAGLPTLGFIFDGYDKIWSAIDGDLGNFIGAEIRKRGELQVIAPVLDLGFRQLTSNKRPILEPKDLKGFRVRTPQTPFLTSLWSALGAAPTPLPFPDLYTALQTGLVDGQENPLTLVESFRFYEVQKYCTLTRHTWDGWLPVANTRAWERLPADLRSIVSSNFRKAALLQRKDVEAQNAAVQTALAAKGMQFYPASTAFRDALRATDFYSQWKAKLGDAAWAALERNVGKLV